MSNPEEIYDEIETADIVDQFPDALGDKVTVGWLRDAVLIGIGGSPAILNTPELRDRFAKAHAEAERQAEAYAARAAMPGQPVRRPCCDHCNNGEGDPAGHDYTLSGPHDGPCGECASEQARREHDEGTG